MIRQFSGVRYIFIFFTLSFCAWSAPTITEVNATGIDRVTVKWNGASSGWQLEYSDDLRRWLDAGAISGTEAELTGLPDGQIVFVRLRSGTSTSNWNYATTLNECAGGPAPAGLTCRLLPDGKVKTTWHDRFADESGFQLQLDSGSGFADAATATANSTSALIDGVDPGVSNSFRIRATASSGESAWSPAIPLLITGEYQVAIIGGAQYIQATHSQQDDSLIVPSGLSANSVGTSSIELSWTSLGAGSGEILVTQSWDEERFVEIDSLDASATNYTHKGALLPDVARHYRLFYKNSGKYSAGSDVVSVTLQMPDSLAAPQNLTAVDTGSGIELSWTGTAAATDGYAIESASQSEARFTQLQTVAAGTTSWTHSSGNARNRYRIQSLAGAQRSPYTEPASAEDPTDYTSPALTSISAASATAVDLAWSQLANGTPTGYMIERRISGSTSYDTVGWAAGASNTSWTDESAAASTSYDYRVWATDWIYSWTPGAELSVTTPAENSSPNAPDQLDADGVGTGEIALRWRDRASNETSFRVERAPSTGDFSTVATLPANCMSYHDTPPSSGSWRYRIVAANAHGESTTSNVSASTAASDPTPTVTTSTIGTLKRLVVTGSAISDDLEITQNGNTITVTNNGSAIDSGNDIDEIVVAANQGDDTVTLAASLQVRAIVHGGDGADSLTHSGSSRATLVTVGGGNDSVIGNSSSIIWCDDTDSVNSGASAPGCVRRIAAFYQPWSDDPANSKFVSREPQGETWEDPGAYRDLEATTYPDNSLHGRQGPVSLDVNQGDNQNCGDTSVNSHMAEQTPDVVEESVCDLGDGTYAVHFGQGNGWFARLDGSVNPTKFSEPGPSGSLWWLLLEKAVFGFDLPYSTEGIEVENDFDVQQNGSALYTLIKEALAADKVVKVRTTGERILDAPFVNQGHAYALMEAYETASGEPRFILRNPYGRSFTAYNHEWVMPPEYEGFITVSLDQLQTCTAYGITKEFNDTVVPGAISFSVETASCNENAGSVQLTLSRAGGSDGAASVRCSTANGSADADQDYTALDTTVSWSDGESVDKTVQININNDNDDEADETFTVALSEASGASLVTPSQVTVTIVDDDETVTPGTLNFTATTAGVNENAGAVTLTVQRTGGSDGAASIDFATSNGSADAGSDYTAADSVLNWSDGDNADKSIIIDIANDHDDEPNESFTVTLSNASGAALGGDKVATVTIVDNDDAGDVSLSVSTVSVDEDAGTVSIDVTRTGGDDGAITVDYATGDDSAAAGQDYSAANATLNWAHNDAATKTIQIDITDDTVTEGDESFTLTLSSATNGATIGTATATITINANDQYGAITLPVTAADANEGDNLSVVVERNGGSEDEVSVYYETVHVDTDNSDYTSSSGTLTWADGNADDKTIDIDITDDSGAENDEVFRVELSSPTGGASIDNDTETITILANDSINGVISLNVAGINVDENGGSVILTVSRTGGTSGAVSVDYATTDATATAGADYNSESGTLIWADGNADDKTIEVSITDDSDYENDETFAVNLTGISGGAVYGTQATEVTIVDDDGSFGAIALSVANISVDEDAGMVSIQVTRTGGSDGAVSVDYITTQDTATAGADYTSESGTLSWADGNSDTKTIAISITDDAEQENEESFTLDLSNVTGGATLGTSSITITINANDAPTGNGEINVVSSVDFGTTYVEDGSVVRSITIGNTGAGMLLIQDVSLDGADAAAFSVTAAPASSIAAGSSTAIEVTFDPADEGSKAATLTIQSDDPTNSSVTIDLTGEALAGSTPAVPPPSDSDGGGCGIASGLTVVSWLPLILTLIGMRISWRKRSRA